MNGKPRKIGVMNPYRFLWMFRDKENTDVPPPGPSSTVYNLDEIDLNDKNNLDILNEHFRVCQQITNDLSYEQLFDPMVSPLFIHPMGIEKLGHGLANPNVKNPPSDNKLPAGALYIKEPRLGKSEVFGDIIQGAAVNCYFHAALHSTVWVNWNVFPPSMDQIKFSGQRVNVTAKFLVDANGKPVGAQLSPNNEYWGCAWEKAYAEYKGLPKNTYPNAAGVAGAPPYDPDVLKFSQGDTLEALSEITNLPYDFTAETFGYPSAYDGPNDYASCYATLQNDNAGTVAGNSMITANPTVAWTKEAGLAYGPKGAIIANHSYSILGTFRYGNPLVNYIVFRNPWGIPFSTLNYPLICQGGAYNPGLDAGIALGPNTQKGIFAFRDTAFKNYFAGFGWVQAP